MATIQDIAKKLGVSNATVSRALNNDGRISISTRKRVVAVAEELEYTGYSRKAHRTSDTMVGIITPEILSNNYSSIASTIVTNLLNKGYVGLLGVTDFDKEVEKNWLVTFAKIGVAGIIVIMYNDSETIPSLIEFKKNCRIPVIQIANFEEYSDYDSLMISNSLAAKMITTHLNGLGHRDVGIITDVEANRRASELLRYFGEQEIRVKKEHHITVEGARFEKAGYEGMMKLLQHSDLPSAIVTTYDYIAIGALRACEEKKIRVPEDLSLISIDNIGTAAYTSKALTTVSMPTEDVGRIATTILTDRIRLGKAQGAIQHISLNPELIIRETTAPLKCNSPL